MRNILFASLVAYTSTYADIAVIVAKTSPITSLSKKQLQEIYLKKQQFFNEIKLMPINLQAGSGARNSFERAILKMDEIELGEYWNEKHYNGVNPPMVQKTQEAVKAMVKKAPGSIGYIDESLLDDTLRVVATFK